MKKKLIVFLVILIIIASVGALGYFLYQKNKPIDPFELEWVRIYYDYMRENHENLKINQNGLKYYRENEKIEFCEIEDINNPIMLYNYKELGVSFTNIFYIDQNNSVKMLKSFKKDFDVIYLYDVEEQKYEYYAEEAYNDKNNYTKISESINANEEEQNNEEAENTSNILTFGIEEKDSVTTLDGQVIEISKFDQKFIKTTVIEDNWKDINFDNYEDAIKKDFSVAVINMEKVLTEEVGEEVSKKEGAILSKKEEMIKAIQEIEQKQKEEEERRIAEEEARIKAEEEAKKKAEEEAKKAEEEAKKREEEQNAQRQEIQDGNITGNYTLKYGTYKGVDYWDINDPLSKYEITIVLKEDGTYTQTKLITVAGITENYSGKFYLSNVQGIGAYITFSANEEAYIITGNNEFTSETGAIIKYVGN